MATIAALSVTAFLAVAFIARLGQRQAGVYTKNGKVVWQGVTLGSHSARLLAKGILAARRSFDNRDRDLRRQSHATISVRAEGKNLQMDVITYGPTFKAVLKGATPPLALLKRSEISLDRNEAAVAALAIALVRAARIVELRETPAQAYYRVSHRVRTARRSLRVAYAERLVAKL